jgi:hypothetical protein
MSKKNKIKSERSQINNIMMYLKLKSKPGPKLIEGNKYQI